MKSKRPILAPLAVAAIALLTGGWFLQRGTSQERNVYFQARLFEEVMHHVSDRFVDAKQPATLYRMAIDGLLQELGDPHSVFMTPEDYERLRVQTQGEYGGLGIQIDVRDGWVTVIAPLPGTPAERAGLQAGDRIIEVDGVSTKGWTADDAVAKLRGPKGAPVDIEVARVGADAPIPFRIVRDEIHVNAVPAAYMVDDATGYVELTAFSESSTEELRQAVDRLRSQGMRRLILDLRSNPGGLLDQGVAVSDLFLERGRPVVEMKGRIPSANQGFHASEADHYPGMPVVVLVGPGSASASEIVAGALQDHDRALLIGQTTFGKGSVQTLFPLNGNNFLKLTTARWYTPSGRSIQKPYGIDGERADGGDENGEDESELPEYRTSGGRVVYGGGGIRPDLVVPPDTLTEAELDFARKVQRYGSKFRDALYGYAIQYSHDHPELKPGFPITPAMLDGFFRSLPEHGIEVERDAYDAATRWLSQNLAVEIARARWGTEGARKRVNEGDTQFRTAVELLREAKDPGSLFVLARQYEARLDSEGGRASAEPDARVRHP